MSAGPGAIAVDATIVDWPAQQGGNIVVLRKGTSEWARCPIDPKSGGPYIMWDGTPYEHVMLPVTDMPQ
jgi:hypothetical protein